MWVLQLPLSSAKKGIAVCKACIIQYFQNENTGHCPLCETDLGTAPMEKLRFGLISPPDSFITSFTVTTVHSRALWTKYSRNSVKKVWDFALSCLIHSQLRRKGRRKHLRRRSPSKKPIQNLHFWWFLRGSLFRLLEFFCSSVIATEMSPLWRNHISGFNPPPFFFEWNSTSFFIIILLPKFPFKFSSQFAEHLCRWCCKHSWTRFLGHVWMQSPGRSSCCTTMKSSIREPSKQCRKYTRPKRLQGLNCDLSFGIRIERKYQNNISVSVSKFTHTHTHAKLGGWACTRATKNFGTASNKRCQSHLF